MTESLSDWIAPPPALCDAAEAGELVVFVGAGISRLVELPSWDKFADEVLDQLIPEPLNYYELSQIKTISDPKKRLSIAQIIARENERPLDYKSIFSKPLLDGDHVYTHINRFNCVFVTTNYDTLLKPESRKAEPESNWRFYRGKDLLRERLDDNGNVIHLHGCIEDEGKMVITTSDYLQFYSTEEVKPFLIYLFKHKTVLFVGYGLEEVEILEYILRQGETGNVSLTPAVIPKRFMLQGFFDADEALFKILRKYYSETFGVELLGFSKDLRDFYKLQDILANWVTQLTFEQIPLTDKARALMEEIHG